MSDIRQLPAVDQRVETGPVQFGDDWPGTFIRGDCSAHYACALYAYMGGQRDIFTDMAVKNLLALLNSSNLVLRTADEATAALDG